MEPARVAEILEALRALEPAAMSSEELAFLANAGLVVSYDRDMRDRIASRVAAMPALSERVRELSRAVHGWRNGTGVFLGAGGEQAAPGAREALRSAMDELEDLARSRAVLESLVWNDATENFILLTLEGRRSLADLRNWSARLAGLSYEEVRARLGNYRASLANAVGRAEMILRAMLGMGLLERDPESTRADLRLASIALTPHPGDRIPIANEFAFVFTSPIWEGTRREDRLVGSVVLAGLPGDAQAAMQRFQQTRFALGQQGIPPEEALVVAAALADLPDEYLAAATARLAALRTNRPGQNPVILSGLARSPFPVEEGARRLDEVSSALGRLGYADGEQMFAASAILAASSLPLDAAVDRFRKVAGRLPGAFYSPLVAGALLATSPLEPGEAVEALEECIGAVTRGSFFDLTLEIESLALILAYVVEPVDLRSTVSGVPPPMLPPVPAPVRVPVSTWLVPHNVWVYRPIIRYIASHPAHVHTIAGFA